LAVIAALSYFSLGKLKLILGHAICARTACRHVRPETSEAKPNQPRLTLRRARGRSGFARMSEMQLHISETTNLTEETKSLIEKAKARGWSMVCYGRGMRHHSLCDPTWERVFRVSIAKRMPCRVCQPITYEEAEAMAWAELFDWIKPDKLRRIVG
jgi:hypothetical protein